MWERYTAENRIPRPLFDEVFQLLSEAIPPEERREESVQHALLQHSAYTMYACRGEGGNVDAMLAAWEFPRLRFVEHFAVHGRLRGQGLGGKLLQEYLQLAGSPVALEVEPKGNGEQAVKRIRFYEKNGFHLCMQEYAQPPLQKGFPWVPLHVMSWPSPLSEEEFEETRTLLYREVYALSAYSLSRVHTKHSMGAEQV